MRRIEGDHQPVEKPPPRAGGFDKDAVHARRQPGNGKQPSDLGLRDRLAVAPHHPASGIGAGQNACPDLHRAVGGFKRCRHSPLLAATALARQVLGPCAPQPAARRQKRYGFHEIGLAGAVFTKEQDVRCADVDPALVIVPEVPNRQPGQPRLRGVKLDSLLFFHRDRQRRVIPASASERKASPRRPAPEQGSASPGRQARIRWCRCRPETRCRGDSGH